MVALISSRLAAGFLSGFNLHAMKPAATSAEHGDTDGLDPSYRALAASFYFLFFLPSEKAAISGHNTLRHRMCVDSREAYLSFKTHFLLWLMESHVMRQSAS